MALLAGPLQSMYVDARPPHKIYTFNSSTKQFVRLQEMVSTESKASMVIAGRGARACDMCGKERARWYCAADEAYLCEKCDSFVHSANAVARRHERVRLGPNGAPMKLKRSHGQHCKRVGENHPPSLDSKQPTQLTKSMDMIKWCNSTEKHSQISGKASVSTGESMCMDVSTSSTLREEKDSTLLLYDLLTPGERVTDYARTAPLDIRGEPFSPSSTLTREYHEIKVKDTDFAHEVPTYGPLLHDLMSVGSETLMEKIIPSSPPLCVASCKSEISTSLDLGSLALQTCKDGNCSGPKNKSGVLDAGLGPLCVNGTAEGSTVGTINGSLSPSEDSNIDTFDVMDLCSAANFEDMKMNEGFLDADMWKDLWNGASEESCNSVFEGNPFKGENKLNVDCANVLVQWPQKPVFQKPLLLRLDYEDVITAWLDRGSLWMDGQRPQIVPDINLVDQGSGMMMEGESSFNSTMSSQAGQVPSMVLTDRAREARVLRYKEKRRTRFFSKKIRYEVRKLNAEMRPRMKGRFVKTSAITAIAV